MVNMTFFSSIRRGVLVFASVRELPSVDVVSDFELP